MSNTSAKGQIYEHLKDYVDLEGHINFAEEIIAKYSWDPSTKEKLSRQLNRIRTKQNDKCLNLSVVGEFSTGKSSFINALLECNLLVSSIIQGTTVVNTIIEYCEEPTLYILKKDGSYDLETSENIKDLSGKLSDVTTNSDTAREIKLVRVGLPSPLLAEGIRIIDTPGTNSLESWHEDVTRDALRNLSDLSIILTDAMHPLPMTLLDFIDENLSDIYNQCAFVVTYYDKLRQSDRDGVLKYIKGRLHNELGIIEPKVLPYVAPAVLAALEGTHIMSNQQEMVAVSKESYSSLVEIMWKNRQISQIKKLLSLTKKVFESLEQGIEFQRIETEKERQLLERTKQASLEPFVEAEKERCLKEFGLLASELKDDLEDSIATEIPKAKSRIRSTIRTCNANTADIFKSELQKTIPDKCNREIKSVTQLMDCHGPVLLDVFSHIMGTFHENFEGQFNKLGILKIKYENIQIEELELKTVSLESLKELSDYLSNEISNENWAMGGGAAAGAAIGTAICPGIGTIIGLGLGLVVGCASSPSEDELKKNACEKLTRPLDSVFDALQSDMIATFNDNIAEYKVALVIEIERYLEKYKHAVDQRIEQHNSLVERNKEKTQKIENDLRHITFRRDQLKTITKTLN